MILAVIHLVPIVCYGAFIAGGALVAWLSDRAVNKEPKKKKEIIGEETVDDILSQDLLAPMDKNKEDDGRKYCCSRYSNDPRC